MPTRGNTLIQHYERDKRKHLYHGSTRVLHPVLECAVLPVLYQYTGTTVVVRKYVCVRISDKPPNTTVHVWATLKCDVLRDWVVVCVACSTYSTAAYLVLARTGTRVLVLEYTSGIHIDLLSIERMSN